MNQSPENQEIKPSPEGSQEEARRKLLASFGLLETASEEDLLKAVAKEEEKLDATMVRRELPELLLEIRNSGFSLDKKSRVPPEAKKKEISEEQLPDGAEMPELVVPQEEPLEFMGSFEEAKDKVPRAVFRGFLGGGGTIALRKEECERMLRNLTSPKYSETRKQLARALEQWPDKLKRFDDIA